MEQSMEYVGVFGIMSTLKVGTIQDHANSNTAIEIASDGTFKASKVPAFRVHTSSNVSASNASWTNIPLNSTSGTLAGFDTHSMNGSNKINITAATAGIYFFTGHVRINNNVPYRLLVRILRVADQVYVLQSEVGSGSVNLSGRYQFVQCNGLVQCSAGDSFQMDFYQTNEAGSTLGAVGVNSHETFMSGFRISA